MILTRNIVNNVKSNLINSTIIEYDIVKSHPSIMYVIDNDEEQYKTLINMPKDEYNKTVGLMIKNNRQLRKDIDRVTLEIFNEFIEKNNISNENLLATTPDSILIANKMCPVLTFKDKKVVFRNKENIIYTSCFHVSNTIFILYDSVSNRMRIKGVGTEEKTKEYIFVNEILTTLCYVLSNSHKMSIYDLLKYFHKIRKKYLNHTDKNVYRDITNKNKFLYYIDGNPIYSDIYLQEDENCILDKSPNYLSFIMPLCQSFM